MNNPSSSYFVPPNQPLRKPSSNAAVFPWQVSQPVGAGPRLPPASGDTTAALGSMPSPLRHCHFCGHQGSLRCSRCKMTTYCSPVCQMQDWKDHRQICGPADPQPAREKPNQTAASATLASNTAHPDSKLADAMPPRRVYLKDLHPIKLDNGADIQAAVVEFCNPGRFFLHLQIPKLLQTLQMISSQLLKTPSCPPAAPPYVPCVGEVCAAQFSDDLVWYRGLVQELAADKKSANILYIDYGNEEDVPVERMRPLPADLELFYPCAMECRVAGVEPLNGSWSAECCSAVTALLAGRVLTVQLVETLTNVHARAVDIELPTGKRLSSVLIDGGFAKKPHEDTNAILSPAMETYERQSRGKDDNVWPQPPEPLTQAVGDSFSAMMTHFLSPNHMIVQKLDNTGDIRELQLNLRQHCSQIAASQNFRPAPGSVCCAQFSVDQQWYRAKVLAYTSEERICVDYIDYGNSEDVHISCLRPISSSLLALPMQAIPCSLAGIQPVGESWSEEALLALQRKASNRILYVEIKGSHKGKALVVMVDCSGDLQCNIAELLVSAGYASLDPVKAGDGERAPAEPPALLPLSWSSVQLPADSLSVTLLVVMVNNPGEFFCHIDNPADTQRLMDLKAELKQHCEADETDFKPKVGEPCCAMFPGGYWYRAMVNAQSDDTVAVDFVDYGYSTQVERRNLRSITPPLLQLPFQAIRCFLSGVEPINSDWSSEAISWFHSQVEGQKLSARTISITERGYGVELQCKGRSIAVDLVSNFFARYPAEIQSAPSPSAEQTERSDTPRPEMPPDVEMVVEKPAEATASPEETAQSPQQIQNLADELQKNAPIAAHFCSSAEPQIQRLELMMERLESLMELLLSSLTQFSERLQL
ncbi:tudor domain-containing protein 1 isoform X2 [Syngnathus scovelli]|uniref:tudor domain-containing protein 1 isoform X2 n=1 Tax=Syngnathus scovelli TaxID=161590 RepID=UPI00210F4C08|nr:tudor domain-containing protein 1 isoform X2 [Syngnathus scovelli]